MKPVNWEIQYRELIERILAEGEHRQSRAGNTISLFGTTLDVNMTAHFPLVTARKMFYKGIFGELAAMFKGPKSVEDFTKYGCNYWNEWAREDGSIDVDYGNAWIDFDGVNQLEMLVETLKTNPNDRRMIISGWRPNRLKDLSLPCCHMLYQWYVRNENGQRFLDMMWYQRSADIMVGVPSDVALAAAWNLILANEVGMIPGNIKMIFGDTHIYENHLAGVLEYVKRQKVNTHMTGPRYNISKNASVFNFEPDMITLAEYAHLEPIKFKLNV